MRFLSAEVLKTVLEYLGRCSRFASTHLRGPDGHQKDRDCCKANRKIVGYGPSAYFLHIQIERQVGLADDAVDNLLASHVRKAALLRSDDFDRFIEDRRWRLVALIDCAIGKQVNLAGEEEVYEVEEVVSFVD